MTTPHLSPRELPDGAVLAPATDPASGEVVMRRLEPGTVEHRAALDQIAAKHSVFRASSDGKQRDFIVSVVLGFLVPVLALVWAIIYLGRGELSHAAAVVGAAAAGMLTWLFVVIPVLHPYGL